MKLEPNKDEHDQKDLMINQFYHLNKNDLVHLKTLSLHQIHLDLILLKLKKVQIWLHVHLILRNLLKFPKCFLSNLNNLHLKYQHHHHLYQIHQSKRRQRSLKNYLSFLQLHYKIHKLNYPIQIKYS